MAVFPLLLDPAGYRACELNLLQDDAARGHWLDLFVSQFEHHAAAAMSIGIAAASCAAARDDLRAEIDAIRREPGRHGRLDVLLLCEVRHAVLTRHGIRDEFRAIKDRENEVALAALPDWLCTLDGVSGRERLELHARASLAGNLFDMGAPVTAAAFAGGGLDFDAALARVPARPWFADDLDHAGEWLDAASPRRTVIFADNAGPDLVLGVLPLAQMLLARSGNVVIAANAEPTLNDVTIGELPGLVDRYAQAAGRLERGRLRLVDSGSASPLIDLSDVSRELAEAAEGADLVVICGMGRGVESNWTARFRCAVWRLAMIKDAQVAQNIGAGLFDAVCRFDAGTDD